MMNMDMSMKKTMADEDARWGISDSDSDSDLVILKMEGGWGWESGGTPGVGCNMAPVAIVMYDAVIVA